MSHDTIASYSELNAQQISIRGIDVTFGMLRGICVNLRHLREKNLDQTVEN